jgi:hypothetical protein
MSIHTTTTFVDGEFGQKRKDAWEKRLKEEGAV